MLPWGSKKSVGDLSSLSDTQLGVEADTVTLRTDALNDIATLKKDFSEAKELWEDCVNRLEAAESASEHGHVENLSEIVAAANAVVKKLAELRKLQGKFDDGIRDLESEIAVEVSRLSPEIAIRTRNALDEIQQELARFKALAKAPVGSAQWYALDKTFSEIQERWIKVVKASLDYDRRMVPAHPDAPETYSAQIVSEFNEAKMLLQGKPGASAHLARAEEYYKRARDNFGQIEKYNKGDLIQDLLGLEFEIREAKKASR